jgi:hypothetical protein
MTNPSPTTPLGTPIRVTLDGRERTGEFAGPIDRKFGRVRIGHRVRTVALADIEVIVPDTGDRWAELHVGRRG